MSKIDSSARVSPDAELGRGVVVGPFCLIRPRAAIGPGCILDSYVVVEPDTRLGADNRVFHGAVLGAPPQHPALGAAHRATAAGVLDGPRRAISGLLPRFRSLLLPGTPAARRRRGVHASREVLARSASPRRASVPRAGAASRGRLKRRRPLGTVSHSQPQPTRRPTSAAHAAAPRQPFSRH